MAFTRNTSSKKSTTTAPTSEDRNKVAGYLNINIKTQEGNKRLGGSGIQLRESHPLEGAILEFCRKNPDRVGELAGRIEVTLLKQPKKATCTISVCNGIAYLQVGLFI